ncbi:MAG: type IV pilus modification protein PilV [Pseudomonadales bacterium]
MMMKRNDGFTLIEVLVAILIVAVGILGVAGMQVVSLQQNRNALLRDTSLQLGNDILDRMRANRLEVYSPVALDDPPDFTVDCNDNDCDRDEMREFDLAQWKCRLDPLDSDGVIYQACTDLGITQAALPGGRGSITGGGDGSGNPDGSPYEVTVEWIADRDGNRNQIVLRAIITDRPV